MLFLVGPQWNVRGWGAFWSWWLHLPNELHGRVPTEIKPDSECHYGMIWYVLVSVVGICWPCSQSDSLAKFGKGLNWRWVFLRQSSGSTYKQSRVRHWLCLSSSRCGSFGGAGWWRELEADCYKDVFASLSSACKSLSCQAARLWCAGQPM